ncbi:hypothetical protein OHB12_13705 [Nocardia sp. NBC_01730]|uniref:DUF6968 family protein n=1 Tax=Nocardia sp. NBC_01730 TaxID=2975998 RepID=UPI002E14447F|nr:hypothetical protein OHB12_13705 [Nocardia sp. NBC_01730]
MTDPEPAPSTDAIVPDLPSAFATTGEIGKVLATREIRLDGRSVLVIVGEPQRFPSTDADREYLCRLQIEGLRPTPVALQATGPEPVQALLAALIEVSARLSVTLTDFLAEAHIGGVHALGRA